MHSQGDVNGRHLACSPNADMKPCVIVLRAQCALVRTSYKPMPQEILLNQQHASIYDDDLTGRVPTSHKA